jgi:hypothetical protein
MIRCSVTSLARIIPNTTYFRFSVNVKNAKGCGSSFANATVNPSRPPIHWNGTLFNTASGYYNYQWYLNNTRITGANGNNFQPAQTGYIRSQSVVTIAILFPMNLILNAVILFCLYRSLVGVARS